MLVNLAGGNVVFAGEGNVEVAFVVSKVKIDLAAVVEDKDLSVPLRGELGSAIGRGEAHSVGAMVPASTFI